MISETNSNSDGQSDLSLSLTTQVCGVWKKFLHNVVVVVVVVERFAVVIDDVFVVDCDKLTMNYHYHHRLMMAVDMVDVKTA
jgi:hypothetical protein